MSKTRFVRVAAICSVVMAGGAHAELVDRVAAVVNNDIVPLTEVEQRAAPELARLGSEANPQARTSLRHQALQRALDQIISEKLLDQQIKEQNIEVSDQELDAALEDVKRSNNLDGARFEELLRNEGFSMASYRDFMRKHLAKLKLVNLKVRNKVKVSDEDLKAEYQRYAKVEAQDPEIHARHILIKLEPNASRAEIEKAHQRALRVAAEAKKPGVNFVELAKKLSEGPSSQDGGDLGYFRKGVMLPDFEKVAFALQTGEVSDPVQTKFGWHIIKVEDRRGSAVKGFEDVKESLRERLTRQQLEKYTDLYVQELKQTAIIEVKI